VLSFLCICLRLFGFSLVNIGVDSQLPAGQANPAARVLQFGIRDVLLGTTAMAILLGIAKAGDLLQVEFVKRCYAGGALFILTLTVLTASVMLIGLWAALGRGSAVARGLLAITVPLLVGLPLGWYCVMMARSVRGGAAYGQWVEHWYWTGYWWVGWMFLTGALLAAALIIFRTLGYRLVRRTGFQSLETTHAAT
jgi:hypothetical protein